MPAHQRFSNAKQLLSYLNETCMKLHKAYEDAFWISYMGDHSVDEKMKKAEVKQDAFRADRNLKEQVDAFIKKTPDKKLVARLKIWSRFFSLFQTPPEAVQFKKAANDLEAKIHAIRSSRKEGYTDPYTGAFVEASEHKMATTMRTNPDEKVRKACFDAMETLQLGTLDLYIEMVGERNKFAQALGYEDFYDYKIHLDEGMTKDELFAIFNKIYEKTKYAFRDVRELEKEKPGLRKPWNFAYMLTGDFVKEEDQYFQFENVLSYWGTSFHRLGVGFQGGKVTLDLLDRKGKHNNGFCHYPTLVHYKNGKLIPGSSNFTSNAVPGQIGSGIQGIHTVFHEAGHAADRLNSTQEEVCINTEYPPATVSWAETHSMFMDSISDSIEWKMRYAKNSNGVAYPFELFEKKLKATIALNPLDMMHVIFVMDFERRIYERKALTKDFVLETAKYVYKKYMDRSEDSLWMLRVSHIYSWNSSAYYHGYGLAELGVQQWRDYFFKKYGYIVDNPNVGKEMQKVWKYASLYTAGKFVKMATGKKLSADAYIKNVTRSYDEIIRDAKKRIERLEKVPQKPGKVELNGRITMVHGKQKIADNSKSFEDMDKKYRAWLATQAR